MLKNLPKLMQVRRQGSELPDWDSSLFMHLLKTTWQGVGSFLGNVTLLREYAQGSYGWTNHTLRRMLARLKQ